MYLILKTLDGLILGNTTRIKSITKLYTFINIKFYHILSGKKRILLFLNSDYHRSSSEKKCKF